MSQSTARTSPPADTQMTNSPLGDIVREHITFENSQIGPVETVDESLETQLDDSQILDDGSQGMPSLSQASSQCSAVRTGRATFKFARRKLLAKRSLFLKESCRGLFPDSLVESVGRIQECPRSKNNNRYRIDWRPDHGKALPSGLLSEHLEEYFPNSVDTKVALQHAIERYKSVYGEEDRAQKNSTNIDGVRVPVSTPATKKRPACTPPHIVRWQIGRRGRQREGRRRR